MRPWTYYNEIDPYCVLWLRNLISNGLISPGEVDPRPIQEVQSEDLKSFTRCHFFAGIAGWDYALQLAEWPDDLPIWTGSCPCQPFSAAGKRKGESDSRHLWPEFLRLICDAHPARIAGEQVASKDGREWLAGVRFDLETLGYEVGCADLCVASAGAPHIRQRLWWIASSYPVQHRLSASAIGSTPFYKKWNVATYQQGWNSISDEISSSVEPPQQGGFSGISEIPIMDDGLSPCMGGLRATGNAIVPQVAAEVLKSWLECRP